MVDPFSTAAGAVSLVDVALRTCLKLYDLISYLKDVPQLSQRLQRSVHSIDSILLDLNTFVAQYRSSARLIALPDSVNKEIIFIKEDLIALASLLPNSKKVKWVLNRKKLADLQQSLRDHQTSLILAFQSFASQQGIALHEVLLNVGEDIKRHHDSVADTFKATLDLTRSQLQADLGAIGQTADTVAEQQQQLHTSVEGLQRSVENSNVVAVERFDAIQSSLSHMQFSKGHIRSETVLSASTEHLIARVVRAELQRVVVPTVKQCFDQLKANSDSQLDSINSSIDEVAHQVERGFQSNFRETHGVSTQESSIATDSPEPLGDLKACGTTVSATTVFPDCFAPNGRCMSGRRIRHWRRSWTFHWAIGTCWISISTTQFRRRRESNVFYTGGTPFSQNAYRVTIDFLPTQSLVAMRGIALSLGRTQDQRGYPRISPAMSTFAVVPGYADVMTFAEANNVEGLQYLFERGLAAPSDRDKLGRTPLMHAAMAGAADVCRLLLNEGSDPLALDQFGWRPFDLLTESTFWGSGEHFTTIVRLLKAADEDVLENDVPILAYDPVLAGMHWLVADLIDSREELGPTQYQLWLDRGELLRQLGFQSGNSAITYFVYIVMGSSHEFPRESVANMLSVLLKLGADINSVDKFGNLPLHWIMYKASTEYNTGNFTGLALALLQYGADPCGLDDRGWSLLDCAERNGLTVKWYEVLEEAGFDIEEVEWEIEKRKWCYKNPGLGFAEKSTAVAAPSTEGLSRRRAIAGDRLDD